jgi:hypothetical protein
MDTLFAEQEKAVWGPSRGLEHTRAYWLGSNPEVHGQGLAKAIILKIFTEVSPI